MYTELDKDPQGYLLTALTSPYSFAAVPGSVSLVLLRNGAIDRHKRAGVDEKSKLPKIVLNCKSSVNNEKYVIYL